MKKSTDLTLYSLYCFDFKAYPIFVDIKLNNSIKMFENWARLKSNKVEYWTLENGFVFLFFLYVFLMLLDRYRIVKQWGREKLHPTR